MIYKRYELSKSLTGDKIVHIARNAAGSVVFRESSEAKLKKAIDKSIEERQRQEELEIKKKAEQARARKQRQKRKLFAPPPSPEPEPSASADLPAGEAGATADKEETKKVLIPPQQRVTRGADGKFISRAQETENEPKKKSFWDKLR